MKQYLVDGLGIQDTHRLKKVLDVRLGTRVLEAIYWVPVPEAVLTPIQKAHAECAPHVVALLLEEGRISCEFLIRTMKVIRCDCMAYATAEQRIWIMDMVDDLLGEASVIA